MMQARILEHLGRLVGFDTQNPPRDLDEDAELFAYLRAQLPGFDVHLTDLGDGCFTFFATTGDPRVLINVHLDTVPAASGYSADPHTLRAEGDRVTGLGACDIKGAAACALAAVESVDDPNVALLFTTDEEAGTSRCVRHFCRENHDFDVVLVAEPTRAKAVTAHRGIITGNAHFQGVSGHASSGNADRDSALHAAIRWSHAAMDHAADQDAREVGPLKGICFNIGRIEGGVKPNMIADETAIQFGFRPLPGDDGLDGFEDFADLTDDDASFETRFVAPGLPAQGSEAWATTAAEELGLEVGDPVSFWTEAALFSEAGYTTLVYGPGDIAQAHTADEWVAIDQLVDVATHYQSIMGEQ